MKEETVPVPPYRPCAESDNDILPVQELSQSGIARLGVRLHQTGGWIDAGFRDTITLAMANVNSRPVKVSAGMPIGQLVFYTTERAENPYYKKGDATYSISVRRHCHGTMRIKRDDVLFCGISDLRYSPWFPDEVITPSTHRFNDLTGRGC